MILVALPTLVSLNKIKKIKRKEKYFLLDIVKSLKAIVFSALKLRS